MKIKVALFTILLASYSYTSMAGEEHQEEMKMHEHGAGGDRIMFRAGGIGAMGYAGRDLDTVGLAYLPINHMMVAVGLGLTFNANGFPDATGKATADKWATKLVLAAEYMIHDVFPFAMGPQFTAIGSLSPGKALDNVILVPAWGFWYAPFNAPVAIGSALAVAITLTRGAQPVVSLLTPGLRLVYVFN